MKTTRTCLMPLLTDSGPGVYEGGGYRERQVARSEYSARRVSPPNKVSHREATSRARAQELSIRYELSDLNASALIKIATFPTVPPVAAGAPHLVPILTIKQAAQQFAKKEALQQSLAARMDPLLTDRERIRQQRKQEVQRNIAQMNEQLSPATQLSRPPFGHVAMATANASIVNNRADPSKEVFATTKKAVFTFDTMRATAPTSASWGKVLCPSTPDHNSVAPTVVVPLRTEPVTEKHTRFPICVRMTYPSPFARDCPTICPGLVGSLFQAPLNSAWKRGDVDSSFLVQQCKPIRTHFHRFCKFG
jgi:hypothetical protein